MFRAAGVGVVRRGGHGIHVAQQAPVRFAALIRQIRETPELPALQGFQLLPHPPGLGEEVACPAEGGREVAPSLRIGYQLEAEDLALEALEGHVAQAFAVEFPRHAEHVGGHGIVVRVVPAVVHPAVHQHQGEGKGLRVEVHPCDRRRCGGLRREIHEDGAAEGAGQLVLGAAGLAEEPALRVLPLQS